MTDTIKKYLTTRFLSEEYRDSILNEHNIPIRVGFQANIIETIKKYPILESLGEYGGKHGFIFNLEKCNNLFGGNFFEEHNGVTSFMINIALYLLLDTEAP